MIDKYIGKSPYDKSILVRCDCGLHFMEIYFFSLSKEYSHFGIEWHSPTLRKCKYPDFEFLNVIDFKNFRDAIELIGLNGDIPYDIPLTYNTSVRLGRNRQELNGSLQLDLDAFGYLNFIRYDKKGKCVWTLSVAKSNILDLVSELDKIKNSYFMLMESPFTEFDKK